MPSTEAKVIRVCEFRAYAVDVHYRLQRANDRVPEYRKVVADCILFSVFDKLLLSLSRCWAVFAEFLELDL